MTHITDGNGGNAWTMVSISACEFFRKVHRIAMTSAVSTGKNFTPILQALNHCMGCSLDVLHLLFVCRKRREDFKCFLKM